MTGLAVLALRARWSAPGCCGGGTAWRSSPRPATSCAGRCRRRCSGCTGSRSPATARGWRRSTWSCGAPRWRSRISRRPRTGAARPAAADEVELGAPARGGRRGVAAAGGPLRRRRCSSSRRPGRWWCARTGCGSRRRSRNLVANAIEHGGGEVRVRARAAAGGGARVEVTDGGPGLPAPARRARRGGARAARSAAATGSRSPRVIARRHGGRLVTAPSPRGARLVLELPLAGAPAAGRRGLERLLRRGWRAERRRRVVPFAAARGARTRPPGAMSRAPAGGAAARAGARARRRSRPRTSRAASRRCARELAPLVDVVVARADLRRRPPARARRDLARRARAGALRAGRRRGRAAGAARRPAGSRCPSPRGGAGRAAAARARRRRRRAPASAAGERAAEVVAAAAPGTRRRGRARGRPRHARPRRGCGRHRARARRTSRCSRPARRRPPTTRDAPGARTVAATLRVTVRQAVYLAAAGSFAREIRLLARAPGDRGAARRGVSGGMTAVDAAPERGRRPEPARRRAAGAGSGGGRRRGLDGSLGARARRPVAVAPSAEQPLGEQRQHQRGAQRERDLQPQAHGVGARAGDVQGRERPRDRDEAVRRTASGARRAGARA